MPTTQQPPKANQFAPGASGNLRGRAKVCNEVTQATRLLTAKCVKVLEEALDATRWVGGGGNSAPVETVDHQTRTYAAQALLDRGWGRPVTADIMAKMDAEKETTEKVALDVDGLTVDQLNRIMAIAKESLP